MEICDLFYLKHLIKEPTCFKSDSGTIIDNFLSNKSSMFPKSGTLETGISDHHKLVYTVFRCHLSKQSNKQIIYRSCKSFIEDDFISDVENIPFHICEVFEDVDDQLYVFETLFTQVYDMFHSNRNLLNPNNHLL